MKLLPLVEQVFRGQPEKFCEKKFCKHGHNLTFGFLKCVYSWNFCKSTFRVNVCRRRSVQCAVARHSVINTGSAENCVWISNGFPVTAWRALDGFVFAKRGNAVNNREFSSCGLRRTHFLSGFICYPVNLVVRVVFNRFHNLNLL